LARQDLSLTAEEAPAAIREGGKSPFESPAHPSRNEETAMRIMVLTALGLAALIAACVVSTLPRGTTVANELSVQFDLIDILKLTKSVEEFPVDEYEVIRAFEIS
jgi:hypothetical protein